MTTDGQDDAHRYHLPLAAAFVRGRLGAVGGGLCAGGSRQRPRRFSHQR